MRLAMIESGITPLEPKAERSVVSALSGIAVYVPRLVTSSTTSSSGQRLRTAAIALSRHSAPGTQLSLLRSETKVAFDAHPAAGAGLSLSISGFFSGIRPRSGVGGARVRWSGGRALEGFAVGFTGTDR